MHVILTRSAEDNAATAPVFEERGISVASVPMIELRPLQCDACGLRAVRRLAGGEHVLLSSAFATELWLDLRDAEFREPDPKGYLVVGEASAALLRDSDPMVPIVEVADSGADLLARSLEGVERLLYPCSVERRDELVEGLRARGISVVELPLYTPAPPDGSDALLRAAYRSAASPFAVVFYSPSAVHNFFSLRIDIPSGAIFGAIGRTTAEALRDHGITEVIVPGRPGSTALADALETALSVSGKQE